MNRNESPVLRLCRWGFVALVAFAPLPFGSVVGWSTTLLTCGVGLLLAAVSAESLRLRSPFPAPGAFAAVAGTSLLLLPAALQLIPLPASLMGVVQPASLGHYEAFAPPGGTWFPLSQNPDLTRASLIWIATCGAAALLTPLLFDRRSVRVLLAALLLVAAGEAFYGLLQYLSGWNRIFLYEKQYYTDSVTGTYINRNHFAGLMILLVPLGLSWLLAQARWSPAAKRGGWRSRLAALASPESNQILLLGLALTIMGAGLSLSYSRAGVAMGLLASLVILGAHALSPALRGPRRRARTLAVALVVLAAAALPVAMRGTGRLATAPEDVSRELAGDAGRPAVWRATVAMAIDHPVLGTGLGTFGQVFPRYRGDGAQLAYAHAHQDYLEWISETGLLGGVVALLIATGLALALTRALRHAHSPMDRALILGVAAGLAAIALHGLADFNFHIPANALLAAVLIGILLTYCRPTSRQAEAA
jgi:O-antigen ligase